MPSIIPSWGTAPGPANFFSSVYYVGDWTVGAGTYISPSGINWAFQATGGSDSFVNNGTIWWDVDWAQSWTFTVFSGVETAQNTGKIVVIADDYPAGNYDQQDVIGPGFQTNSGQIFSITTNGDAIGAGVGTNSGLIAAQSLGGIAIGTTRDVATVPLINTASGQILAEGSQGAIGVDFGNGSSYQENLAGDIQNAGLIQAVSLDPSIGSVGIYLGHSEFHPLRVINSGTIRADYAVFSDDDAYATNTQMPVETIVNQSGGLIEGIIALNRGNDRVENDGTIRGDVILGEGNDVFDTIDGSFEGIADLGWGNDQFLGSAGADRVAGDNGNDTITGNGGNDLLLGGGNDDTLVGGAGNDGLFGEYGNDRIVTAGGDYADGGEGDDRIELGDYTFEFVTGGAGFDTLVLPGPAGVRTINLSSALGEGAFAEFEQVELTGGKTLIIQASDITSLTGGETALHLATTLTDRVKLVGAWTRQADQTIDGVVWRTWTSGGVTILVRGTGTVSTNATSEPGALDPFAGGELAPLPGTDSGLDLTSNAFFLYNYELTQSVTVNPEEIWWNDGLGAVLTIGYPRQMTLTNHGDIVSFSEFAYPFTRTIEAFNLETLYNDGVISALSTGTYGQQDYVLGYSMDFTEAVVSANAVTNVGVIEAQAVHGMAIALSFATYGGSLANSGEIYAFSENGAAVGVEGPQSFTNTGSITAVGGVDATAVILTFDLPFANDGFIEAATFGPNARPSIGVDFQLGSLSSAGHFTNNGIIIADIAVRLQQSVYVGKVPFTLVNNGELRGDVVLGAYADTVVNAGLITGTVELGGGNDQFDGSAGQQALVLGGDGNDAIIGGELGDHLAGGAGVDTLTGGDGGDSFTGTAAELDGDTIADLAIGDRIVITDASLAGFTFSLSGNTLTYSDGSLTLQGSVTGHLVASAAAGGGVQLALLAELPEAVRNDFNGDGRSDILWRSDSGQFSNWLANPNGGWVNNDANAFAQVPTSWQVTGTGDYNGDGFADVLWRSDSGQLSNWLGNASGGFTNNDANAFAAVPVSWQVTATGDFNGDGYDDILWRSDSGQLSNWLGNASGGWANNDANAFAAVPTSWQVAGTGDFNNDGFDDILWRSDAGQLSNWLGTASGGWANNDANAFTSAPTSWHVAGTGDFNGDGFDDILWRSDAGQLSNWLGNASGGWVNNDANAFASVPTNWQVVAVGDYNGDGFADILWRSDTGQLSNWLGTASGGFTNNDANAFTSAPTSWHTQPDEIWA